MYKSRGGWDVWPPRKLIPKFTICEQRTYQKYHTTLLYFAELRVTLPVNFLCLPLFYPVCEQ